MAFKRSAVRSRLSPPQKRPETFVSGRFLTLLAFQRGGGIAQPQAAELYPHNQYAGSFLIRTGLFIVPTGPLVLNRLILLLDSKGLFAGQQLFPVLEVIVRHGDNGLIIGHLPDDTGHIEVPGQFAGLVPTVARDNLIAAIGMGRTSAGWFTRPVLTLSTRACISTSSRTPKGLSGEGRSSDRLIYSTFSSTPLEASRGSGGSTVGAGGFSAVGPPLSATLGARLGLPGTDGPSLPGAAPLPLSLVLLGAASRRIARHRRGRFPRAGDFIFICHLQLPYSHGMGKGRANRLSLQEYMNPPPIVSIGRRFTLDFRSI